MKRKRNNRCNIYYQPAAGEDTGGKQKDVVVLHIYRLGEGIRHSSKRCGVLVPEEEGCNGKNGLKWRWRSTKGQ